MGLMTSSISQLRAMLPSESPVLTAQSFTAFNARVQTYGDTAFVSGSATTTTHYQISDPYAVERQLNQLAQTIQRIRLDALNNRRLQLESEVQSRISRRQQAEYELQFQVTSFFRTHPDLVNQVPLLQTILPWEQKGSTSATLEALAFEAESLLASKSSGRAAGRWYGTLQWKRGQGQSFTEPVRVAVEGESDVVLQAEDQQRNKFFRAEGLITAGGSFAGTVEALSWLRLDGDHAIFAVGNVTPSEMRLHLNDGSGFEGFLTLLR
jgi:hypothetical protein